MAGTVEADFQIVAGRGAAHLGAEQPLDLAARQVDMVGDLDQRQRLGEIAFHQLDDGQHLGVLHAKAGAQRQRWRSVGLRTRSVSTCSQTRLTRLSSKSSPISFSIMSSAAVPPAQV